MSNFNVQTGGFTVSPAIWSGNANVESYSSSFGNIASNNSSLTTLNRTAASGASIVNGIPPFTNRPTTGIVFPRYTE